MKFTKEDARRRVLNCAKQYKLKKLSLPEVISKIINLDNYTFKGK